MFSWPPLSLPGLDAGLAIHVWNANNHQVSWGVLGAALEALWDFMGSGGRWGEVEFRILDGGVEVGVGVLGVAKA